MSAHRDWSWKPDLATLKALERGAAKLNAYRRRAAGTYRQPRGKRGSVQSPKLETGEKT